jgi:hypothetical protein
VSFIITLVCQSIDERINSLWEVRDEAGMTEEITVHSMKNQIFKVKHFQALIGEKQRLKGTPVADAFVIACARRYGGTVVTEERLKPNAAKIPNVCDHFKIGCISLEGFMQQQAWKF